MSIFFIVLIVIIWYIVTVKQYKKTTYYKITQVPYLAMRADVGRFGEYLTYKYLSSYEKEGARFLFNCYLPRDNGETTEIDVLMLYKSGIYVFESKNYSGWIFGNEKSKTWTQTLPQGKKSHKEHFLNPIMQNKLHIKWLMQLLNDTNAPVHSIIVFSERCTLKKVEVFSQDIKVINRNNIGVTVAQVNREYANMLTENDIVRIYEILYPYTQVSQADKEKHIHNIQVNLEGKEAENTVEKADEAIKTEEKFICPRCGNAMVLRTAKRGDNAGESFYGCSSYPKCRYIKKLEEV